MTKSPARQPIKGQPLPTVTDRKAGANVGIVGTRVDTHVGHVGIVADERADRLAAAAARRAHRNCVLSASEREERRLESLADALVINLLAAE